MYYEVYGDINSDWETFHYLHNGREFFSYSTSMLYQAAIIRGTDFYYETKLPWNEVSVADVSVRHIIGQGCPSAVMYFRGGTLNILEFGGKKFRLMIMGDARIAFNEKGSMVMCEKRLAATGRIPEYARRAIQCMESYNEEMMVDEDLPLPLQALLAAAPLMTGRNNNE